MNKKTNTWAALVGSPTISEAVQRIAFSFGYEWILNGKKVRRTEAPVLMFDPNTKTITYDTSKAGLDAKVCHICYSLDTVMERFMAPPVPEKGWKTVGPHVIYKDGSVLWHYTAASNEDMEEVIKTREEFLGRNKETKKVKLPVVHFNYNSPSSGNRSRRIMVVDEDKDYIKGLDVDDGNQYKEFRRDRIKSLIFFAGLEESKEK